MKVTLVLKDIQGELILENVIEIGYYFDDEDQEMKIFVNQGESVEQFLVSAEEVKNLHIQSKFKLYDRPQ